MARKPVRRALGALMLRLTGWRVELPFPSEPKYVVLGVPHTSNWDFAIMLFIAWRSGLDLHWMGKHTLFQGPFGWLFRLLGGIPVNRRGGTHVVEQVAQRIRGSDQFILALAPEGTRGKAAHWRTGFYWIAREAQVPIAPGFIDYRRKVGGIGPLIDPSEPLEAVAKKLESFYANVEGRHPELFTRRVLPPPAEAPSAAD
jgi:1-acyl-sn-glycerol-3-phosphate acyltransferase